MDKYLANIVYDVLCLHAGAIEYWRPDFVQMHAEGDCREYRFQGSLGFGGKFRSGRFMVDCYQEDETPARKEIIRLTNAALAKLKTNEERRLGAVDQVEIYGDNG